MPRFHMLVALATYVAYCSTLQVGLLKFGWEILIQLYPY